jgi:hypothetical protein
MAPLRLNERALRCDRVHISLAPRCEWSSRMAVSSRLGLHTISRSSIPLSRPRSLETGQRPSYQQADALRPSAPASPRLRAGSTQVDKAFAKANGRFLFLRHPMTTARRLLR